VEFASAAAYLCAMSWTRIRRVAAFVAAVVALTLVSHADAAKAKKKSPPASEEAKPNKAPAADATTAPAPAKELGTVEGWTAYEARDKTGRVCYIYGEPKKSEPSGAKRKQPMMMVTHRPEEKIANVVSVMEGYTLKDGSNVALDIGKTKYELFSKDDSAWARTSDLDKAIVTAMAKGKQAVVKGDPPKGSATTDTYPLAGFPNALALIDKACGVKR
jgi:hypothetical protein